MATRPTISLVAVGVNSPQSEVALRYAEIDARRITSAFIGQLGPVRVEDATVLLGTAATCAKLDAVLAREARRQPGYLIVFFAGHGHGEGIVLHDHLYSFTRLRRRLERIGARGTVLLLDSCGAGGFAKVAGLDGVGDLDLVWWPLLFAAVPGTRVFMASPADGTTLEIEGIGGVYTDALIRAMRLPVPGDLWSGGISFVSDEQVFKRAELIMRQRGLRPARAGDFGGFPLAVANHQPIGRADVVSLLPMDGGGLAVHVCLQNRLLLPTHIVATATDALSFQWKPQVITVEARAIADAFEARFRVDAERSPIACRQLAAFGRCAIAWSVKVLDAEGRCLTERGYNVAYAASTRSWLGSAILSGGRGTNSALLSSARGGFRC
jgi:hypothetical protein